MKQIFSFIFFLIFAVTAFSQSLNKTSSQKNTLTISPAITFVWAASLKPKSSSYHASNLITGLNINYSRQDKLKNYHDVGFLIGIIPLSSKKTSTGNLSANQFGVEYNYKIVYGKFKDNNLKIYTAVGTQLVYRKVQEQTTGYNPQKTTSNSFIHNFVVSPGIQYSKNNFFFDFSIPTSIGYNITNQKYSFPAFDSNRDQTIMHDSSQKSNLLNWNVGAKIGVGAKF